MLAMALQEAGNVPENLLMLSFRKVRAVRALKASGSCPVSALLDRSKLFSFVRVDHCGGTVPTGLLSSLLIESLVRLVRADH